MRGDIQSRRLARQFHMIAAVMLALAIFALDVLSPLQGAAAVLYTTVILVAARSHDRRLIVLAGGFCFVLSLVGYYISHWGSTDDSPAMRLGVSLIAIGIAPFMTRDLTSFVSGLPAEQFTKAQTLGANSWQMTIRVALPQLMPRLIEALRLSMGPAWVFLITAEAVASDVGLGYRIFLVRRYFAMDIILPYVAWISLLAIAADAVLLLISRRGFPWAHGGGR